MAKARFIIVGAGVAAATAAETLRSSGFDGSIMMIGKEPDPPYNRPALSKERLRNEVADEQVVFHPYDYYATKEIELVLDRTVARVNVAGKSVQFANGAALSYDKVLIATGAQLRYIEGPGHDLDGLYYLRSLRDCSRLSEALQHHPRVLVVGTGFIGCEVAASARMLGCEVTVVGKEAPLAHVLGEDIGKLYTEYHRGHGVDVRGGVSVERFEGDGRVERALMSDGSTVSCDLAIIGIGVRPLMDVVQGQPIETGNGILVDEFCRTTAPDVFAVGDVAFSWNPRYMTRLRVEHFDNAQHQGAAAAKAMIGVGEPYNPIPSFWSDQYSYKLQYRGYATRWERVVFRGKPREGSFSAFYISDGKVQAICSVNRYKENFAARQLIGKSIESQLLENDGVDIKDVVFAQST
ncbi:MAG: NAD(P)/FAD-dependent oxidoreductase [Vulcanimicrobiaceae bacterium]